MLSSRGRIVSRLSEPERQHLANTTRWLSATLHEDSWLSAATVSEVSLRVASGEKLQARELAGMLWSYATLCLTNELLVGRLASEALRVGPDDSQALANTLWACTVL